MQIDLLELSGGSYEAPAMQGEARDGRTLAREAYFLEMAGELAAVARMPVMVTGGIRRLADCRAGARQRHRHGGNRHGARR
jgi:2,4-dienoyl-CoA reductase-like NADH-dependent reductase (Old Yellow Enzyme family)